MSDAAARDRFGAADEPRLQPQFDDVAQQRDGARLGMWVFLATEALFFGGTLTAFAVDRFLHPAAFRAASARLDVALGAANTAVLLTSSLTMALAVSAAEARRRRRTAALLAATALLGAAFLAVKGVEWSREIGAGLLPGGAFRWSGADAGGAELFFGLYFVTTGLHAVHLVVGVAMLTLLVVRQARGRPIPVEIPGLYWHFVDVVWIFLFPLLYLTAVRAGGP